MTPEKYVAVKESGERIIHHAKVVIAAAYEEARQCPPPSNLRPAKPSDLVEGAVIWYLCEGEDRKPFWNVVDEVLRPDDPFKAYMSDGARYGLEGASVAEKEESFVRMSAESKCPECDLKVTSHIKDSEVLSWDGVPFLYVLCDGRRVKI